MSDLHFVLLGDMDEEGWHCLLDNINSIRKPDQQEWPAWKQGKQDKMNILQYSGTLF